MSETLNPIETNQILDAINNTKPDISEKKKLIDENTILKINGSNVYNAYTDAENIYYFLRKNSKTKYYYPIAFAKVEIDLRKSPELKWFSQTLANGQVRHQLFKRNSKLGAWAETPYFIHASAYKYQYYSSQGKKYGLYSSGVVGDLVSTALIPFYIAKEMGGFSRLAMAKSEAERCLRNGLTCEEYIQESERLYTLIDKESK